MVRTIGRLNALAVARANQPGLYPDGGGLYLQITKARVKSWLFRFMLNGRARAMGLGPLADVTLAQARGAAGTCRQQLQAGVDPIEARKARRAAEKIEAARAMTFRQCGEAYVEAHKAGWRNQKHRQQWTNTLETYAYPVLGDEPVQKVDVGLLMRVLQPIWTAKPETAGRLRGRMENVLDWATTAGHREGANPARWRGHLENLLPRRSKIRRVKHHPALPYQQIGTLMAALRAEEGIAAAALEFTILTAARTSETASAERAEFDDDVTIWTVPEGRIKGEKEHRVPLSAAASAVARRMLKGYDGKFVFPGRKAGRPLSNGAMLMLLERMGYGHITVHGFRSTFRDWAAEQTSFSREVAEMALAHVVDDKVEAAYRRGDLFQKRRRLTEAWAGYCSAPAKGGRVVPIRATGE
jgi:integrase